MADDDSSSGGASITDQLAGMGLLGWGMSQMPGYIGGAFKSGMGSLGKLAGMGPRMFPMVGAVPGLGEAAALGTGMYEIAKPTPANAGEADQYIRDASGEMIPNPKAKFGLLNQDSQSNVDAADSRYPQPVDGDQPQGAPQGAAAGAPQTPVDPMVSRDPWLGQNAGGLAGGFPLPAENSGPVQATPAAYTSPKGRGGSAAPAAAPSAGFFDKVQNYLHSHSNMLLGLGAGLAGKGSFGEAMSAGFGGAAKGNALDVGQNMQTQGIRAAYTGLVNADVDPQLALAAVYNPDLYKALIAKLYGEPKVVDGQQDPTSMVTKKYVVQNGKIVPLEAATQPQLVHSASEVLHLPKGTLFVLPDGSGGMRK